MTSTDIDTGTVARELLDRLCAAWAAGDSDTWAALHLEDATVVRPGLFHADRATMHRSMAERFAGPLAGTHIVEDVESARLIGVDTAVVVSRSGVVMPGQAEPSDAARVRATWVLARRDGEWKVAAYANAPA